MDIWTVGALVLAVFWIVALALVALTIVLIVDSAKKQKRWKEADKRREEKWRKIMFSDRRGES